MFTPYIDPSSNGSRRRFLLIGWLGLIASSIIGLKAIFQYLFYSPKTNKPAPFPAGSPRDYSRGSLTLRNGFWICHDEMGLYAIYGKCSHLGCLVRWSIDESLFKCPCHGSIFNKEGNPVRGPADRPLSRVFLFRGMNGELIVDPLRKVGQGFRLKI